MARHKKFNNFIFTYLAKKQIYVFKVFSTFDCLYKVISVEAWEWKHDWISLLI